MKMTTRTKSILALVLVILLSLGIAGYHGYHKEYLFVDEVLSYTLANSRYGDCIRLEDGKWYSGSDLYAYTYVEKGHAFDFSTPVENQKHDTHPPIYAILLHAFSSLRSGDFSKWFGIGLNLVGYVFVFILLYLAILDLFPNRPYFAVLVCLIFGTNPGIIDLAIFIRMYILLLIASILCIRWHVKALNKQSPWHAYLLLCILSYLGVLTHYFYLVFAFFAGAFYCIYKLFHKEIKAVIWYVGSMAVAAGLVLLSWPTSLWQLFEEEAAEDAFSQQMSLRIFASKILQIVRSVNEDLFANRLKYLALIVAVFAIYLFFKNRSKLKQAFMVRAELWLIVVVNVLFFLTISVITPYLSPRYVSASFPFILLLVILTLEQVANEVFRTPAVGFAAIALFFIWPELTTLQGDMVDHNRQIITEVSTEHAGDLCLFGTNINAEENVFDLKRFDRIYTYDGTNADGAADEIGSASQVVVYVPVDHDPEEYVANIRSINPKLTNLERLYVAYYATCYLMSE